MFLVYHHVLIVGIGHFRFFGESLLLPMLVEMPGSFRVQKQFVILSFIKRCSGEEAAIKHLQCERAQADAMMT